MRKIAVNLFSEYYNIFSAGRKQYNKNYGGIPHVMVYYEK